MGQSLEEAMQKLADILQEFRTVVENQNENENPGPGGGPLGFAKNLLNGPDPKTPAIKFPDKMLVTLDQASIQAIKKSSGNNPLFS